MIDKSNKEYSIENIKKDLIAIYGYFDGCESFEKYL